MQNKRKLSVHHVNYDKNCLCDDNECEFVPLCISCHTKTNHNREFYEKMILEMIDHKKRSIISKITDDDKSLKFELFGDE